MKPFHWLAQVLFLLVIGNSTASGAFLDGQTLKVDYLYPDLSNSYSSAFTVVGSGIELTGFPGTDGLFNLDFSDRQLTINFLISLLYEPEVFNGIRISDTTATVGAFTTVSLNSAGTLAGFSAGRIQFDSENIYLNFSDLMVTEGQTLVLDLNPAAGALNTPEPGSLLMAGLGLAALAFRRRRP